MQATAAVLMKLTEAATTMDADRSDILDCTIVYESEGLGFCSLLKIDSRDIKRDHVNDHSKSAQHIAADNAVR